MPAGVSEGEDEWVLGLGLGLGLASGDLNAECFKMAERFENVDNILRDWAKEKTQKRPVDALNRYEKYEIEKRPFLFL